MGEPLANEGAVWAAVERIHGDLGLSARHITISTVGIVPGIRALAARPLPVNLAVSLHAANDELRDDLVPINRRYPLDALLGACTDYLAVKNRRISFEWALIANVNDGLEQARALTQLLAGLTCHVNLIPLNPTDGYSGAATSAAAAQAFAELLDRAGIPATLRQRRGIEIQAGCGQLAAPLARPPSAAPSG